MPPSAAVWPTSDCLAAGCGELVKVWQQGDPTSEIKIFEGTSVSSVDFSRNNKVLAVAGDKGQVVLYSNRPQPPNGDRAVGRCPDIPKAGLDCITCVRFAASDTHLIGGARNGTVRIWSLRSKDVHKDERVVTGLTGSATSVAINHTTEVLASASSTGQVLLHDFNTGQKWKSLLRGGSGTAAGSLSFSRLAPGQLAGGSGSGTLLVWDVDRMELADELGVHKGAVTGLSFSEAGAELLLSCSADGTAKCTDRRTAKAVWSIAAPRGSSFSSLSAKHDGTLLALGTSAGCVQVHDIRRASTALSLQQFSDTSSPVTSVRWQHPHTSRSSSRPASASMAPSSTVTPSTSVAPPASAAVSSATTATWQRQHAPPTAPGQRASAAAGSTAAAAAAGGTARSPRPEVSNTSASMDFGIRALSPVQLLGSPADEAESAPPLQPAAGPAPGTSSLRTPAAPPHTSAAAAAAAATVTPPALATPTDSLASAGPGAAPFMFTPGIGLGYLNGADTTPLAGADITPVSMPAGAGSDAVVVPAAVAQLNAAAAAAAPEPAAAPAEATGRPGSRRSSSSAGLDSRPPPAAGAGKPGGRGSALPGAAAGAGSSVAGGGSSAASGGGAASGKGSGPSRSNSGVGLAAAAGAAAGGGTSSRAGSRPSTGAGAGASAASGGAAAGGSRSSTRSSADGGADAAAPAAPAAGAVGSRPGSAASAGAEGAGAAELGAQGQGAEGLLLAAPRPGSAAAAAVAVGGLREDVFRAYMDQHMKELKQDIKAMHLDMLCQFHQAQMDLVSVVDGVVQRQDQLAEMVAELAGALQGLRAVKAQPGSLMPWL
uniref:Anaphase-promoting complex subunit 4-like WD40 domain-containing protein n=1 Tax=Tetradesmus obliquus TaxID=3088 RepID=A0A383V7N5_TETOB|eukprot:jgi/Sobl393_1/19200/SZX60594.1